MTNRDWALATLAEAVLYTVVCYPLLARGVLRRDAYLVGLTAGLAWCGTAYLCERRRCG